MIAFGTKVKDSITGFEGIVIARAEYMNGCRQVLVVAKSRDGAAPVSEWIDEQRVTVESKAKVGGPMPVPSKGGINHLPR